MKTKSLVIILIFISLSINAQWQIDIHAQGGISNFVEKRPENSSYGNKYFPKSAFQIGTMLSYRFTESRFYPSAGVNFHSYAAENKVPDMPKIKPWIERSYSVDVPIKANVEFEKWLHFNAGVVNSFKVGKPDEEYVDRSDFKDYSLGIVGGIEGHISNFVIGFNYQRELSYSQKNYWNIRYYLREFNASLAYWF